MTGNSEMFAAEHLMIESASTDNRTRATLGSFIKMVTVNRTQNYRQALTLTPWWRLTISVNEETEHVMVLPPLDDSVKDKMMLLKAFKKPMPMPTGTDEEKAAFWAQLESEISAFAEFLLKWQIPLEMKDSRFGVKSFHHPALVEALNELQPEMRLLNIIDQGLIDIRAGHEWEGSAVELQRDLTARDARMEHEAKQTFSWNGACGTYLGRLEKTFPERFSRKLVHGINIWTIKPPMPNDQGTAVEEEDELIHK